MVCTKKRSDAARPDPTRSAAVVSGRRRLRRSALVAAVSLLVVPLAPRPAGALVQPVVRVLVRTTDSAGGQLPGGVDAAKLSGDGRWLAFSRADGSGTYVKDLISGATTRVSLNDAEVPANAASALVGISFDGKKVAFTTAATNLGLGPVTARDLYVRDTETGFTLRGNYLPDGTATAVVAGGSSLDDDGWNVAYTTSSNHRVFARDMFDEITTRADVSSAEVGGIGASGEPSVGGGGRYVVFTSASPNLVAGDTNGKDDVFQRDVQLGTTTRVSVGVNGQFDGSSATPVVSNDGRWVAFSTLATNAIADDTNSVIDVYRRDLLNLTTVRASVNSAEVQAASASLNPDISDDGRYVAFGSSSANLETEAPNGASDIFRRDLVSGYTDQIGLTAAGGVGNAGSGFASLSAMGVDVAFQSSATNLVAGDTNGATDGFVDRWEPLGAFYAMAPFATQQIKDFGGAPNTAPARTADLVNGRMSPAHLIVLQAHAPAWALHREPVARLYEAFFHREPDLGGLNYWVKKHQTGTKLSKIAASFAGSSEFKTAYGSLDNTNFVKLVYGNVLQRKPDTAGLNHWVAKLAGGMSRGDLMVAFSESSEGKRVLAPEVDSALIGLAMLGKMPPKVLYEIAAENARVSGVPEGVAMTYLMSTDYVSRINALP